MDFPRSYSSWTFGANYRHNTTPEDGVEEFVISDEAYKRLTQPTPEARQFLEFMWDLHIVDIMNRREFGRGIFPAIDPRFIRCCSGCDCQTKFETTSGIRQIENFLKKH